MNPGALTAAHPSLPFGTKVRVTNKHTGRSVVVRINDRGPFVKGRVIDLSPAAARAIGVGEIAQVSLSTN
jgi:rare lipoprotein A